MLLTKKSVFDFFIRKLSNPRKENLRFGHEKRRKHKKIYQLIPLRFIYLQLRRKMLTMSGSIKLCRFFTTYFFRMARRNPLLILMWWLRCMAMHHARASAQTQKQAEQGNQQFCFITFNVFYKVRKNTDIFPCKPPQLQKIKALSTLLKTQVHSTQNASTFESKRKCV